MTKENEVVKSIDSKNAEYLKNLKEHMESKAGEYKKAVKNNDNNFSWVLDGDKEALNLDEKYTTGKKIGEEKSNIKDIRSIKWGIPNMVMVILKLLNFIYAC